MQMHVFMGKSRLFIETNIPWAMKYWSERKRHNKDIRWKILAGTHENKTI